MTLNSRNVTHAEIIYFLEPAIKKLNEDRSMLLTAKFKPVILVCRNIKHMWIIFAGVPSERERQVRQVQ